MSSTASKLPPLATLGPFIALISRARSLPRRASVFCRRRTSLILQQVMVGGGHRHRPDAGHPHGGH